jgi:hypothetical protein
MPATALAKVTPSTAAVVDTYATGGTPINATFDGTNIWVANSTGNSVTKIAASTGATVGTFPAGSDPVSVALDGTTIWVTNQGASTVRKLLASTGAGVSTYNTGSANSADFSIVFDGMHMWVGNSNYANGTRL